MKGSILFLALIAGVIVGKQAEWKAHYLENAESLKAVCSDGSTPLYFTSHVA